MPYQRESVARRTTSWRAGRRKPRIVLLKNDGVLPLSRNVGTIAVIGPTADEIMSLLGNYYGTPAAPVTVLQGIRAAVGPKTKVLYSRGTDLVEGREEPRAAPVIEPTYLRPAPGATGPGPQRRVLPRPRLHGRAGAHAHRCARRVPLGSRLADGRSRRAGPAPRGPCACGSDDFCVRWTGQLLPPAQRPLRAHCRRERRLPPVHRRQAAHRQLGAQPAHAEQERVRRARRRARRTTCKLEYFEDIRDAEVRLAWRLPGAKPPFEEALDAAKRGRCRSCSSAASPAMSKAKR